MDDKLQEIKLNLFANKLSQAYELEAQYVKALTEKDEKIAELEKEISVLKESTDS